MVRFVRVCVLLVARPTTPSHSDNERSITHTSHTHTHTQMKSFECLSSFLLFFLYSD